MQGKKAGIKCISPVGQDSSTVIEELRAELERYRLLLDSTYDWETFHDPEGRILYCSPSCERITGYPPEYFLNNPQPILAIVHADDRVAVLQHFHQQLATPAAHHLDFRVLRPDGEVRHLCHWCQPVHDREQHFLGRRASHRDITTRVLHQEDLQAREARYHAICDAVTDYCYTVRVENGQAVGTHHNPTCLTLTGHAPEEFAANPYLWILMVVAEDRAKVEEQARHALAGENVPPLEHRIIRKDGEERWFKNTILFRHDQLGKLIAYEGVIEDITARKRAEEELAQHHQDLLTGAPMGVFLSSANGKILNCNPAVATMFGFASPAEMVAAVNHSTIPDCLFADPEEYAGLAAAASQSQGWLESETNYRRRDGSTMVGRLRFRASRATSGEMIGFEGFLEDISKRKQIEELMRTQRIELEMQNEELRRTQKELEESRARYFDLYDLAPVGYLTLSEEGLIVEANLTAANLLGVSRKKLVKQMLSRFALKEDCANYQLFQKKLFTSATTQNWELRMRGDNGKSFWALLKGTAILEGVGPSLCRVVLTDVTARKQAELELARSADRFESILRSSLDGFWIANTEGRILEVNHAYCRMSGYSREELLQLRIVDLDADESPAEGQERINNIVARGYDHFEARHRRKDKSLFTVEVSVHSFRGEQFLSFFRDISDRKKAEEELRHAKEVAESASLAKSNFLANMSHEIRTPMNAIIGLSELALGGELSPRQADYLEKINNSAYSLLGIINDILDFSKIEANRLTVEDLPFNLSEVVDSLPAIFASMAFAKGLAFHLDYDNDIPQYLIGDPLRLRQILVNLVSNAIKFTEHDSVLVGIEMAENGEAQCQFRFTVQDTGIGIAPEMVERIFSPFVQADSSMTRQYGGTGLGLSISHRLARLMGGTLEVASVLGQGSTFTLLLPMRIDQAVTARNSESANRQKRLLSGRLALVIDDHPLTGRILTRMLRSLAMAAEIAYCGEEALALLEADPSRFQLILLDWRMPGQDGIETARRIKDDPKLSAIPIIMMTADAPEHLQPRMAGLELPPPLAKPVTVAKLRHAILHALGESEMDSPPRAGLTQPSAVFDRDLSSFRILLVEDNSINQQVAMEILSLANLTVEVAVNGREAVQMVTQGDYDAVLMDIQMPEMDGFTATELIRALPNRRKLPIIAMTAHAMTEHRARCRQAGMNDFIGKPINRKQLLAVLGRWLLPGEAGREMLPELETTSLSTPEGDNREPLAILDFADGLHRLLGNRVLYLRLLLEFQQKYADSAAAVRTLHDQGQPLEARRLVHTIKGLAGNLGARPLRIAAMAVESALKSEDPAALIDALLAYEHTLEQLLAFLATTLPATETAAETAPPTLAAAREREQMAIQLRELDEQLAKNIFTAATTLDNFTKQFGPYCERQQLLALRHCLDRFDFLGAREQVSALRTTLGLN